MDGDIAHRARARRGDAGVTPLFEGSAATYAATPLYPSAGYRALPIRKNIPCDWPYAVRRCNGSGLNPYHYQRRFCLQS